ncbi:LeuA family protein [Catellatospora methionotrophica]|uniref:LeuA family protein n=1 Tax=Catellatospora methionotrophica TaxID=121620 RepID=UPI0033F53132
MWFNWNNVPVEEPEPPAPDAADGILFDETLRDGIQAPNVRTPSIDEKLRIVDFMAEVGVGSADLGFPGSGPAAAEQCARIARHIADRGLPIAQGYAGRTHPADIAAICGVSQSAGVRVEAYAFIGVSPIRQYVEDWDLDMIKANIVESADSCRREDVEFVLVLEDTVRCTPEILGQIYDVAIDCGVGRVTLCDTVGAAVPAGTASLIRWTTRYFADRGRPVGLDWHGHNDRGLALANSLTALALGCQRVHGTILGVGERAGNASIDQLIVNHHLEDGSAYDLLALRRYCDYAAGVLGVDIPDNYPAMGRDVFKTSAGVHATAILKAHEKGNQRVKDTVYSSVPASSLGRAQEVLIDSSSGANNIRYWLTMHGFPVEDSSIKRILDTAKMSTTPLDDQQIRQMLAEVR